jgi:hypothetical protein
LPTTHEAYESELRTKGFTQYKAGYLPYVIIDGWQQVRKDFAYWRALTKAIEAAATPEERAWFEADRRLREKLTEGAPVDEASSVRALSIPPPNLRQTPWQSDPDSRAGQRRAGGQSILLQERSAFYTR